MSENHVEARPFTGNPLEWDAFLANEPTATSSHLFAWKQVIESVYQHDCPYLAVRGDDGLAGLLPLVHVRSLLFGRFLVSMPFLNAGGPIGSYGAVAALSDAAVELARSRRAQLLELRSTDQLQIPLSASTDKVACVLPLTSDPEQLSKALPAKLRSQVRRPVKAGVEFRFGADQLRPFFNVFAHNMRDLGSPTHPFEFFEVLHEKLQDKVWFGCAYYQGKPVAAGCALHWRDEVEITWASSLRAYNSLAPNMLLYWSFIERACLVGAVRFNFGRCTPNSGSHRFKQQWGTTDIQLYWYRKALRSGAATPKQDNRTLSLATRLWQRIPVPIATMVGSRLRGGIPA